MNGFLVSLFAHGALPRFVGFVLGIAFFLPLQAQEQRRNALGIFANGISNLPIVWHYGEAFRSDLGVQAGIEYEWNFSDRMAVVSSFSLYEAHSNFEGLAPQFAPSSRFKIQYFIAGGALVVGLKYAWNKKKLSYGIQPDLGLAYIRNDFFADYYDPMDQKIGNSSNGYGLRAWAISLKGVVRYNFARYYVQAHLGIQRFQGVKSENFIFFEQSNYGFWMPALGIATGIKF